jgi:hypothetical protein
VASNFPRGALDIVDAKPRELLDVPATVIDQMPVCCAINEFANVLQLHPLTNLSVIRSE